MAVNTDLYLRLLAMESQANDLGTATQPHLLEFPGALRGRSYVSGTTDNAFDLVWSDSRSAAAAADTLDLRGVLAAALGGSLLNLLEVCAIVIKNKATTAAHVLSVGAGSNPAFAGLFGATGDVIKVPASGLFVWFAPLDGGGLATTAGTADILTIDPGANTISYDIVILGRSA